MSWWVAFHAGRPAERFSADRRGLSDDRDVVCCRSADDFLSVFDPQGCYRDLNETFFRYPLDACDRRLHRLGVHLPARLKDEMVRDCRWQKRVQSPMPPQLPLVFRNRHQDVAL